MGVTENDDIGCGKRPLIVGNEVLVEVLVGPAEEISLNLVQETKHQPWATMSEHQSVAIQVQVDSLGQIGGTQGPVSEMEVAPHGQSGGDVAQLGQDFFFVEITGVQDEVYLIEDSRHLLWEPWQAIGDVGIG
jgi:hypothetical protein